MVPGFRYHVVTIAAIFLALGVGIVIGSSFVQSAIVARQTRRLDELKAQFQSDIVPLRIENQRSAEFLDKMKPILLKEARLQGARIALVQTGDYPEAVRKSREILEQAGATVSSVTTLEYTFPARCETALPKLLPKLQAAHPTLPADRTAVFRVLAAVLARGGADDDLAALAEAKLIQTEGDYSHPNDYVVLVGGATEENESRAETVDAPLIAELKTQGVTVVAAEPEGAAVSYIPSLRGLDITTVDNADTEPGRICLALALRGERGNYGVKKTASSGVLPPSSLTR